MAVTDHNLPVQLYPTMPIQPEIKNKKNLEGNPFCRLPAKIQNFRSLKKPLEPLTLKTNLFPIDFDISHIIFKNCWNINIWELIFAKYNQQTRFT